MAIKSNTRKLIILLLTLSMIFSLAACSKSDEKTGTDKTDNSTIKVESKTETENNKDNNEKKDETVTVTPTAEPEPEFGFEALARKFDENKSKAKAQYDNEDYTNLAEPVKYNILWLGYTQVSYGDLDFQMTDFDRDYLQAVTKNFENTVERITNNNLDISIDLFFVADETELTKYEYDNWLFLAPETTQAEIDKYDINRKYDTVFTTIQTQGDENVQRNTGKSEYGVNGAILGYSPRGIQDDLSYSTFDLGQPREGTYPLANPEIPSLYATAVAVHEWMHHFEYLGKYLGIEYPPTHAYFGEEQYPGYKKYTADQNNYDFFEFYELVLQGKLPYEKDGNVKHVGMYPEMWPLTKRGVARNEVGKFTIKNPNGEYLHANEDKTLTISSEKSLWQIYYLSANRFILIADDYPDLRIDLNNAWDVEDNNVGVYVYTGYDDAQSWKLTKNADGSYCIRTPYSSGRALSVDSIGGLAYISTTDGEPTNVQKWYIEEV
ncbi:MAG: RICIN domain-containing protein [Lachnospiraceae bacterium]|nr:RICIN domain-containing protein [Lachnospiraceae bacterium]